MGSFQNLLFSLKYIFISTQLGMQSRVEARIFVCLGASNFRFARSLYEVFKKMWFVHVEMLFLKQSSLEELQEVKRACLCEVEGGEWGNTP